MKRLTLLVLCLALLLPGCSQTKQAPTTGLWQGQLDLTVQVFDALPQVPLQEFQNCFMPENFRVYVLLSLTESGTYTLSLDTASAQQQIRRLLDDGKENVYRIVEDAIKQQGLDMPVEEALKYANSSMGAIHSRLETVLSEGLTAALEEAVEKAGRYQISEGKLYLSDSLTVQPATDSYELFTLQGDVLTITEHQGNNPLLPKSAYPLTFHRFQ